MPTAAASVPTNRAGRYIAQLCRHLNLMSRMRHGGQVQQVDWSDTTGTIRFTQGTCTMQAASDSLALRIEADDEQTLRQLQEAIAGRLATIGRRDHLAVNWQQST